MREDRRKYKLINDIMNWNVPLTLNDEPLPKPPLKTRFELVKDLKRELRSQNKPINFNDPVNYVVFHQDDWSYVEKHVYNRIFTQEDIEEYYECNALRINSPYDCTGQLFTISISFFPLSKLNKTIVYHWKGLDV